MSGYISIYIFRDIRELSTRVTEDIHPLILYRHQHHAISGEGILKYWIPAWSFAICALYLFFCLPCLHVGLVRRHAKVTYFILYKTSFSLALFLELLWNLKIMLYQGPIVLFLYSMTGELADVIADSVDCCWSINFPFLEVISSVKCQGPSCLDDFYGPHFIPTFLLSVGKILLLIFSFIILLYHFSYKWERVKDM